jgi:hypothetical protein
MESGEPRYGDRLALQPRGGSVNLVAHFTAAEMPGTFAVLVFGVVIGAAAAKRQTDSLTLAVVGFCGLAAVGSLLDHFKGVSTTWKTGADVAFLLGGLVLLAVLASTARDSARKEAPKEREAARAGE